VTLRNLKLVQSLTDNSNFSKSNTAVNFHTIFLLIMAFAVFIVGPIALIWAVVDGLRRKSSDRPGGGGGISNVVGGAMLELDRIMTRPSVEHTIEAEKTILKREDDTGGQ
jgi:hypothetical protein